MLNDSQKMPEHPQLKSSSPSKPPRDKLKFRAISLGAGVQSSVMVLMAARGLLKNENGKTLPPPKYAVFSDTGWEPKGVYTHLKWLENELAGKHPNTKHTIKHKIEVVHASRMDCKNPYKRGRPRDWRIQTHLLKGENSTGQKFISIPLFILNKDGKKAIGRRQCTREYKIEPIRRKLRELSEIGFRQVMPRNEWIEQWIGISEDEMTRMKDSHEPWIKNRYPLVEMRMNRKACKEWFAKHYSHRTLPRSACIGCPLHSKDEWLHMKKKDLVSWKEAVRMDKALRRGSRKEKFGGELYLHNSMKPLDKIDFENAVQSPKDLTLKDECEGMCGM